MQTKTNRNDNLQFSEQIIVCFYDSINKNKGANL